MEKERIEEIYRNFINSPEYERALPKPDFDLNWLEEKLSFDDLSRLETLTVEYGAANAQFMFRQGFLHAWELFHQLEQLSAGRPPGK